MGLNYMLHQAGLETDGRNLDFFNNGGFILRGFRDFSEIYRQSSSALWPVGTRWQVGERVFYRALAGAGLVAGELLTSPNYGGNGDAAAISEAVGAGTIATKTVTVTLPSNAAVSANDYANGYLSVVSGTGRGQTYMIKSHPAAAAGATCVFTLYDALTITLAATPKVSLVTNLFSGVVTYPITTAIGVPAGVPLRTITSGYYFWSQTWGPCGVLNTGGVAVGAGVTPNLTTTDGSVKTHVQGVPYIGDVILTATNGYNAIVDLKIKP